MLAKRPVHLSLFNLITLIMIVKRTNYEAPHDAVCTSCWLPLLSAQRPVPKRPRLMAERAPYTLRSGPV
jgi:hypothetical protein